MTLKSLLAIAILSLPQTVVAALIDLGQTTRDTSSGLEWLDTDLTLGLSREDIEAGALGLAAVGWRHATMFEVEHLYQNAGIVDLAETAGA